MKKTLTAFLMMFILFSFTVKGQESKPDHDARMKWWREARFGLFIHWGLYAIPAGEWKGVTEYGEWIRTSAKIPLKQYEEFKGQFNPVKFNAREWVNYAKEAGMKYITITTKHHDGFCLFNTAQTDWSVMYTPFKRDIMKEMADACKEAGITLCWYHSIMDWHHPDYLPRREWETDRPTDSADFERYIFYMKNQLNELLTNYGKVGVLWFDGEWENTWNQERGKDLYHFVRSKQPSIIINNRVGAGRSGMEGFTKDGEFGGDFGTPEQEIPATGLPGVDWETCMTMNDHWGYNKNDAHWKSSEDLIRKLADIASKGGNFLLNVGPTSEGLFPQASIDRLKDLGNWMKINGESIYGTTASPFKSIPWGRCTQKTEGNLTHLYFHVFDWPLKGKPLVIPGILNKPVHVYFLADAKKKEIQTKRKGSDLELMVPSKNPDPVNTVIVMEINGKPDIYNLPEIHTEYPVFVKETMVSLSTDKVNADIRYTLDGKEPTMNSSKYTTPFKIVETRIIKARCFRNGNAVSQIATYTVSKTPPLRAVKPIKVTPGIKAACYEGDWDSLPDFTKIKPVKEVVLEDINLTAATQKEFYSMTFTGFIEIPETGVYAFYLESDDGSSLSVNNALVIDNDGLHGNVEKNGFLVLEKGFHPLKVKFFQKTGGADLKLKIKGPGMSKDFVPKIMLWH